MRCLILLVCLLIMPGCVLDDAYVGRTVKPTRDSSRSVEAEASHGEPTVADDIAVKKLSRTFE